jgi:hypothetical protein
MGWIDQVNQRLEQRLEQRREGRPEGRPELRDAGSTATPLMEAGQPGKTKSPLIAAILGFAFNGIGLGIYFRSWVDLLVPVGISFAITILSGGFLMVLTPFVCAFYGYIRATGFNANLTQPQKKTWACTWCSTIAFLAAVVLCERKKGSAESFAPVAVSTVLLLIGWKADTLGNQEKATGCGLLVFWIFLLLGTIIALVGVATN